MFFESLQKFLRRKPYNSPENYNEDYFVDYCLLFYGEEGTYPIKASKLEVLQALRKYESMLAEKGEEIRGDSFDRQVIKDLILHSRGEDVEFSPSSEETKMSSLTKQLMEASDWEREKMLNKMFGNDEKAKQDMKRILKGEFKSKKAFKDFVNKD